MWWRSTVVSAAGAQECGVDDDAPGLRVLCRGSPSTVLEACTKQRPRLTRSRLHRSAHCPFFRGRTREAVESPPAGRDAAAPRH